MIRLVGACVVLSTVLSCLVGVGPAAADDAQLGVRDGRHDVVRHPPGCPDMGCAAPDQGRSKPGADIVRLRARYASDLSLRIKVRGIARRVSFAWRVHAAGTDVFPVVVKDRGAIKVRLLDSEFKSVECDGLSGGLNKATRVASVVVLRRASVAPSTYASALRYWCSVGHTCSSTTLFATASPGEESTAPS